MNSKTVIVSNQISKKIKYYENKLISDNKCILNYINGQIQKLTIKEDCKIYLDPHNLLDLKNQVNRFIKFTLFVNNIGNNVVSIDFLTKSFRIFTNDILQNGIFNIEPNKIYLFHIYSLDNGFTWRILLGSKFGPDVNWGESDPSEINNGIKQPTIIGELQPIQPTSVYFPETSPFENLDTALILDNHIATEYRITNDIIGNNVIYSIKSSDDLLGNILLNLTEELIPETEYYISCRYFGNLYISDWSDPIGVIMISCTPDTPFITSYTEYNFHIMSSGGDSIDFISSEYMTNTDSDKHRMSDFKLCSDEDGLIPIYEINNITNSEQLTNYSLTEFSKLTPDNKYYLFARYYGTICGVSDWSDPVMIEYINGLLTQSKRKLYRHESNKGTVMEYYEYDGSFHKVVILDAKYRIINKLLTNSIYLTNNLKQYPLTNSNKNAYIDGNSYNPPTTILNTFTDNQINSIWKNQDVQNCKYNVDTWLMISSDTNSNAGLYKIREQTILGGRCDIPTVNLLMRMYIEADNIDSLDPTAEANNTKALGKLNSSSFFGNNCLSSTRSTSNATHILQINKNSSLSSNSFNTISGLLCPVFELYDKNITTPQIYNYSSNGDFNSTYLKTEHTEDHIKTNWQIFSDPECSNMLTSKISDSSDPEYISFINDFKFEDNLIYYIKCQHVGSYSGESDWSNPYQFKYLINKNKIYRLLSKRKIYRHKSNKGTVLEYIDYNNKLVKLLILDSAYRREKQFAKSNFNNTQLTSVDQLHKYNNPYISTSSTKIDYNTANLPIYTDSKYNDIFVQRHHTSFNGNAKQSCDTWMSYSQINNSVAYSIPYCRTISIDGLNCDLPTIDQLRLIFLESENLDSFDSNVFNNKQFAFGKRNSNLFWGGTYNRFSSCSKMTSGSSYQILSLNSYGSVEKSTLTSNMSIVPILEIPDEIKIQKPIIITPLVNETIYTNSSFVYIKSNTYSSSINDKHSYTNWKICSDINGEIIISQSFNDSINLTEIILHCDLQKNNSYYIFVQYCGSFGEISDWSDPIKIINGDVKITKSNRKIYRHESNLGSVLEFNDNGVDRKVVILDSKYRKLINKPFGLFNINVNLDNYSDYPTLNGTFTGEEYNPYENIPISDDNTINSTWGEYLDKNLSSTNCDVWMNNKEVIDINQITGCPIIQYCRETLYDEINISCDLPNINTLLRIYFESEIIDEFDPTLNEYKQNKLSLSDDSTVFWGNTIALSSTNYDEFSIRTISYNGYITKYNKKDNFIIINNNSLPFFIIPIIEITNSDYKINTPEINYPINGDGIYV